MSGKDSVELPIVSAENFAEVDFSDKFFFFAHQFGTAGKELMKGRKLTDLELGIPDPNERVEIEVEVPDPNDNTRKIKMRQQEKRSVAYPDEYKAELNSGLRQKQEHEKEKQKMCGRLLMQLDKTLRTSVVQHADYAGAVGDSNIIDLWRIVKECATGRGAQTANVKISRLLSLEQKAETLADFETYAKDFQEAAIDVLSLGNPADVLDLIFDGKFMHGLKKGMFKEQIAIWMAEDPDKWSKGYKGMISLLTKIGRTQNGLTDDGTNKSRRKDNTDGSITADAARTMKRDNGNNNRRRDFTCFNCGKSPSDHSSKHCPEQLARCRQCGNNGHLDRFCDAINGRRNNNNPPPQRNNNNYNNGRQQQRPPPNHYGNRPSPQAGRGPPLPFRRPNINARLTNVGSISDEYSTSEPLQQQYDQNTGYYPPEIQDHYYTNYNDGDISNPQDEYEVEEDGYSSNYQQHGYNTSAQMARVSFLPYVEEELSPEEKHICCFKCKTLRADDISKVKFVFDSGCVGDGTVINNKDLFQYLSKKRNFKINGFDGKGQTSQISGHVDCIGEAVYVEDSPNNLLNANLFCKEHDLVYHGDHAKVSLYTRDGNQHVITAYKDEEGFLSFTYGDLLKQRHLLKQYSPPKDEFCIKCNSVLVDLSSATQSITCNPVGILAQPTKSPILRAPSPHGAMPQQHFSAEQIARAKEAYQLCGLYAHPGDQALLNGLRNGNFLGTHLNEKDLIVARQLFGPCMACTEGKMNAPPPQPSQTPPATRIGEKIFADLVAISAGCYNSYTFALFAVDEKSAYRSYVPLKTKSLLDVKDGFETLIAEYTLHGHVVSHFVLDDESVFNAMRRPLAVKGIHATVTPAGLHNKRCERYWQTHLQRDRSVRADLPYALPPYLEYHLAKWVVDLSNAVPSKATTSRVTPFELFTKQRAVMPPYKFGQPGIFYSPRPDSDQRGEWGIFLGLRDNQVHSYIAYFPMRTGVYSRRKFTPFHTIPAEWNFTPRIRPPEPKSQKLSKRELTAHYMAQQQSLQPTVPQFHATPTSHLPSPPPPQRSTTDDEQIPYKTFHEVAVPSISPSPRPPIIPVTPRTVSEGASPTSSPPISSPPPVPVTVVPPPSVDSSGPVPSAQEGPLLPISRSVAEMGASKQAPPTKKVTKPKHVQVIPPPLPPPKPPPVIDSTHGMVTRNRSKHLGEQILSYDDRAGLKPKIQQSSSNSDGNIKSNRLVVVNRISLAQAEKEAEQDPSKRDLTDAAVRVELMGLLDTRTLVPRHVNEVTPQELENNCIDGFLFLDDKYLSTGEFEKRKARLVIMGSQQKRETIGETRAPTVNPITVSTILAIAATNKSCSIETADVVAAFLTTRYNKSKGKLYLRVRDRRLVNCFLDVFPWMKEYLSTEGYLIFEVDTYIYGLAAAAREFNVMFDKILRSLGFRVSDADPCLYLKRTSKGIHIACTHVDDVLSIAPTQQLQDAFMSALGEKLKIKRHVGDILSYIGMTINRNPTNGSIKITQDHYIQELIKKYDVPVKDIENGLSDEDENHQGKRKLGKPVDSPAAQDLIGPDSESDPLLTPKMKQYYQSLIMTLMYSARLTRIDTLFAVTYLATKCSSPRRSHLTKALRVVKYIKGTPTVGICYYNDSSLELKIHADASHLIHPEGYGHTGIVITLGRSVVFARSVKQRMQTLSSTESELLALQEASTYVVWMRHLMHELGFDTSNPTIVTQDNQSATTIAEQGGNFQRTKHLVGRFNFLIERIRYKELVIKYLATEHMPADFLTKPLPGSDLRRHMNAIGMVFN